MRLYGCALWVAIFVVAIFGIRGVCAGSQSSEQEVKAVEQRWLENEENPQVVATILAVDFVHVLTGGFITKEQHLAYLRNHPNAFPGKKKFEELQVRVYGDVAVATGIVDTDASQNNAAKRTAFTDVFVRRGREWQAVNAQELPLQAAVKPAP